MTSITLSALSLLHAAPCETDFKWQATELQRGWTWCLEILKIKEEPYLLEEEVDLYFHLISHGTLWKILSSTRNPISSHLIPFAWHPHLECGPLTVPLEDGGLFVLNHIWSQMLNPSFATGLVRFYSSGQPIGRTCLVNCKRKQWLWFRHSPTTNSTFMGHRTKDTVLCEMGPLALLLYLTRQCLRVNPIWI